MEYEMLPHDHVDVLTQGHEITGNKQDVRQILGRLAAIVTMQGPSSINVENRLRNLEAVSFDDPELDGFYNAA